MNFSAGPPIHVFISEARQGRAKSIEKVTRTLEELGYWAITVPDHIISTGVAHLGRELEVNPDWRYADPISMLAYFASVTTKMKLIPRVIVLPYRNPFHIAHAMATIDCLSGGRLIFGPAAGYEHKEFEAFGIPREERGKIANEYLQIIINLWTKESVTYSGNYYRFTDASLLVKPVQKPRPQIWVGGNSRAGHTRAVKYGEGWTVNCAPFQRADPNVRNSLSREELIEEVAWSKEQRKALGKPPLHFAVSCGAPIHVLDKSKWGRRSIESISRFTCEGTPEELVEEFSAFRQAGADSFVVSFFGNTIEEYLHHATRFAKEVMPAFEG